MKKKINKNEFKDPYLHLIKEIEEVDWVFNWEKEISESKKEFKPNPLFSYKKYYETQESLKSL